MLEYEKKLLLTESEYEALKVHLGEKSVTVKQTNYYFDTEELSMNKKGITCRIRAKDGKFRVTVKNHCMDQENCSHEVTITETTKFDASVFNARGLHLQGELITERTILYKDSFCEMVIDKNTYLGKTDYELEIEYAQGHEDRMMSLLTQVSVALLQFYTTITVEQMRFCSNPKSKSQRFFEKKINQDT